MRNGLPHSSGAVFQAFGKLSASWRQRRSVASRSSCPGRRASLATGLGPSMTTPQTLSCTNNGRPSTSGKHSAPRTSMPSSPKRVALQILGQQRCGTHLTIAALTPLAGALRLGFGPCDQGHPDHRISRARCSRLCRRRACSRNALAPGSPAATAALPSTAASPSLHARQSTLLLERSQTASSPTASSHPQLLQRSARRRSRRLDEDVDCIRRLIGKLRPIQHGGAQIGRGRRLWLGRRARTAGARTTHKQEVSCP